MSVRKVYDVVVHYLVPNDNPVSECSFKDISRSVSIFSGSYKGALDVYNAFDRYVKTACVDGVEYCISFRPVGGDVCG